MKKLLSVLLAGGLLFAASSIAPAAEVKPTVVWEDPAGDADLGQGLGQSIPGGWDLVSGTIQRVGADIQFTVTHADMPPVGSMPEATRFLWNFNVNKTPYRITAKSADIGKPDVIAGGTGQERVGHVDTAGHFRIEGECITDQTLPVGQVNCPVVGYVTGTWDPASMSFTVVVPMKLIKAKPGSSIIGGGSQICTICWVSHYAERSLSTTIIDTTAQVVTYKIPK
ncbi:MAG: hypothetical protein QOK47_119 [Actinomycetota bacterium]|jgi:hypothetical protein|nr:hypothetical protein [Actinomycetota bacterium]MEA2446482.1 hypothetical protein [Actinomycetota bacterium]